MGSITRGIANNILGNGAVDGTDALSGTIPANNIANASLSNLTAFPPSVSAGIPQVASDPPSPTEGDVWYNTSTYKLKVRGVSVPAGTWASGGNINTTRNSSAGAGTQTAGILMGGRLGPPTFADQSQTELYNGSAWTEVNDLNTARYAHYGANSGSQTATLAFAGYYPPGGVTGATESWDGTNWTELNDLNTAGGGGTGFGTQTAAVAVAGDSRSNLVELWNGTSWTEVSEINTTRNQMAGFGISTAGLICGGDLYPVVSPTRQSVQTELWDGSSWTEVNDLNTGRRRIGQGGFGTQTSGLTAGGYVDPGLYQDKVETWNGTSWTEQTEIQTRDTTTGIGTGAGSGLIAGGGAPGAISNATEEWTAAELNQNVTLT